MAGSNKGLDLFLQIAQGALDATGLESELTGGTENPIGAYKIAVGDRYYFKQLMDDPTAVAACFGSATSRAIIENSNRALEIIASSSIAVLELSKYSDMIKKVLTTRELFNYYRNNSGYYANLKAAVNASGSKLKRQIFTSSGTFVIPGAGLNALCALALGGGGRGATAVSGGGGGGGGGCEINTIISGLPGVNQTITVGSGGPVASGSTFDTLATGAVGADASTVNGGSGGGADTGNGLLDVSDVDLLNAAWQFDSVTVKGGDGADQGGSPTFGISQYFAAGGQSFDTAGFVSAPANSGNGGNGYNSVGPGEGGSGLCIAYYIEND